MSKNERAHLIRVARSWHGTPYRTGARVKGHGADCITFIAGVFTEAGLVPHVEIPPYSAQWHLNRDAERYLEGLLKYTHEIEGPPNTGDIALWKFGRCFSHGAIVMNWPQVMHAYVGSTCRFENAETAQWLRFIGEGVAERGKPRPVRFFSFWD